LYLSKSSTLIKSHIFMVVYRLDALKIYFLEIAIQILKYGVFLNASYGLQTMKKACQER